MKVKDLMEELKKFDQDKEIEVCQGDNEKIFDILGITISLENTPDEFNQKLEDDEFNNAFFEKSNEEKISEIKKVDPKWEPTKYEISVID